MIWKMEGGWQTSALLRLLSLLSNILIDSAFINEQLRSL